MGPDSLFIDKVFDVLYMSDFRNPDVRLWEYVHAVSKTRLFPIFSVWSLLSCKCVLQEYLDAYCNQYQSPDNFNPFAQIGAC